MEGALGIQVSESLIHHANRSGPNFAMQAMRCKARMALIVLETELILWRTNDYARVNWKRIEQSATFFEQERKMSQEDTMRHVAELVDSEQKARWPVCAIASGIGG
jgi:hypothetical protein